MKLLRRFIIWINVIKDYILSFNPIKGKIISAEKTIEYTLKNHKSIIRYGDGEFKILNGQGIHYQKHDIELQENMKRILCEYHKDAPYLLCVPYKYFSNSNMVLNSRVLISCWGKPKKMFKRFVKKDVVYGDAFVFAKNNKNIYYSLWKDYSNIIFVHNDLRYINMVSTSSEQSLYYIKVPNRDSYNVIDKIEKEIISIYENNQLQKTNTVVLISAGPMAKVLVYRLANKKYFALDCGHIWDDPLEV